MWAVVEVLQHSIRTIFFFVSNVTQATYQLTRLDSDEITVLNVYRSSNAGHTFIADLKSMLCTARATCVICGDFNIDYMREKEHAIVQELSQLGFTQKVEKATHDMGGLLDHVWTNNLFDVHVHQQSPYFSDHDIISVTWVPDNAIMVE